MLHICHPFIVIPRCENFAVILVRYGHPVLQQNTRISYSEYTLNGILMLRSCPSIMLKIPNLYLILGDTEKTKTCL